MDKIAHPPNKSNRDDAVGAIDRRRLLTGSVAAAGAAGLLAASRAAPSAAAEAIGETKRYIIFGEILPNAIPPAIVNTSLEVGRAIIVEAGLSFIGLGDPNRMSWGYMLRNAQAHLRHAWWMAFFPGICIFLLVTALNLVGDGLNDVLNPRLKER